MSQKELVEDEELCSRCLGKSVEDSVYDFFYGDPFIDVENENE